MKKRSFAVIVSTCFALTLVLTLSCSSKKAPDEWWTLSQSKGDIPDQALVAKINGKVVKIAAIQINQSKKEYRWDFSTGTPSKKCQRIHKDEAVHFRSTSLVEGTFEKALEKKIEFKEYHSYYHFLEPDGTPNSINVDWGAKIVVGKIDEENKKVTGWISLNYKDRDTSLLGKFEADLCKKF